MAISALIPAFNEESTIVEVITTLKNINEINEIIVISDGSEDNTALVAKESGVTVIELPENRGKGAAIKAGLENSKGDIILLLDADLLGLTEKHVKDLLVPVIIEEVEMTVGIFSSGRLSTDLAHKVSPYLSGQRAIRKTLLDKISDIEKTGYGIEIALTIYVQRENILVKDIILEDLTHVMKEEKFGVIRGFGERMKMYWQIYRGIKLARR